MPRINQTQVNASIGLTFSNGLRALLRQDPDILMVGEIRDKETASLAVNAALTGHLVLSTLHTNSAAGAIPRILDLGVEPFLISSTLNVIIAQRLVRKLCDAKERYVLSKDEFLDLSREVDFEQILSLLKEQKIVDPKISAEEITFWKATPSKECKDGYRGRVGIYEVLRMTETIKELVMQNATADVIEKRAKKEGMIKMIEDGFVKAAQGFTTIEEVLRVTRE